MNGTLLELFRHKTWATLRLIDLCQGVGDEHLDATIPGTYGTIRDTLRHIVAAEEGYYSILTRKRFATKEEGEAFVRPDALPESGPVPLEELAKRVELLGPRWEALIQDADLPTRVVTTTDGFVLPGAVPMAQTIHHADDHRTHILSILGARGFDVPELDLWAHAEATRQVEQL